LSLKPRFETDVFAFKVYLNPEIFKKDFYFSLFFYKHYSTRKLMLVNAHSITNLVQKQ